jgi:hypothetical protein
MIDNKMTKACVTVGVLNSVQCGKCTKPGTDPDAAWQ